MFPSCIANMARFLVNFATDNGRIVALLALAPGRDYSCYATMSSQFPLGRGFDRREETQP
jgi:hypothetical protein